MRPAEERPGAFYWTRESARADAGVSKHVRIHRGVGQSVRVVQAMTMVPGKREAIQVPADGMTRVNGGIMRGG